MKKNVHKIKILSLSILFLFQACGTVSNEYIEESREPNNYKQVKHTESKIDSIPLEGFASDSITDKNGNFYFATTDNNNFRIIKVDKYRDIVWANSYETTEKNANGIITIDNSGNIFVSGDASTEEGRKDIRTIKVSPDGELIWSVKRETEKNDTVYDIETDSFGNLYIVGMLRRKTTSDNDDSFILKYTASGLFEWSRVVTSKYFSFTSGIEIDKENTIYVSGITGRDIFFANYSTSGRQKTYREYLDRDDQRAPVMSLGLDGYIYIAGKTSLKKADGHYLDKNANRLYIKKIDKNGREQYFKIFDYSDDGEVIHAVTSDKYGNVYLYGEYYTKSRENYIAKLFLRQLSPSGETLYNKIYTGSSYGDNIGNGSELYINSKSTLYIVDGFGQLKLKDNEKNYRSFILELSATIE